MKEKEKNILNEEREITLAPREELLVRAKEIAEATLESEKFLFTLHYDTDNAGFVKKALNELGVTPEEETEDSVTAHMNMEQLEFMKSLDCIEKVTEEERDKNRKLRDFRNKKPSKKKAKKKAKKKTAPVAEASGNTAATPALMNDTADTPAVMSATAETQAVATLSGCCCCPTNTTMEKAQEIKTESLIDGCICCPGTTQWFKFTAPESRKYTILTVGSLDTMGTLYNAAGEEVAYNNDFAGKTNFRIIQDLIFGETYYIKVEAYNSETGNYMLKITKNVLANYVTINKHTINLKKGTLYELPITPNYTYKEFNGARGIAGLSVSITPYNTYEKKIWWWSQYSGILKCFYDWDNNGNRYIHISTPKVGAEKLYAIDWKENGRRDECTVYVHDYKKIMVISCSDSNWVTSSEIMGRDMAMAFNCEDNYIVEAPTNASSFKDCWNMLDECVIIHTHGGSDGLFDHVGNSKPKIISKYEISCLPRNDSIYFIMMTACNTAGGAVDDNVAYWLSKKINPKGIVIANTDVVSGGSTSFEGFNKKPTWKVYKNGIVQNPISDIKLTMKSAYNIYQSYK